MVRLRYKIEAAISSTAGEDRDLGNARYEVVVDSQGEGGAHKMTLAGGAVDVPLCMGDVGVARFVLVRATPANQNDPAQEVRIRLNSVTGEQISLAPVPPSKEGYLLLTGGNVTALYATNMGTTAMSLTVSVAGD